MKISSYAAGAVALVLLSAGLVAAGAESASADTDLSDFQGFFLDQTWVAPGNDFGLYQPYDAPCAATSAGDSPLLDTELLDGGGTPINGLQGDGFGDLGFTVVYESTVPADLDASTPIYGHVRVQCTHTDGSAAVTLASIPLTISNTAPASEFNGANQYTFFTPGDPDSGTIMAMGFQPGETVKVTATDYTVDDAANYTDNSGWLAPISTTADGAGAIEAKISLPSSWASTDDIGFVAAGQTGHYLLSVDSAGSGSTPEDHPLSANSPGRASGVADENGTVQVTGSGFVAGEDVVVALHSNAAPIILSTVHADNTGSISEPLTLPTGVTGTYRLWAGAKTESYLLLSTPLQINATTSTTTPVTIAGGLAAVPPSRLLDTRSGIGASGPVAAFSTISLQVDGRAGVPSTGVSSVVLNVTVTAPTDSGFLTVYADGTTQPTASNVNFVAGQTVPNLVVAPVGADGKVAIYSGSAGTVQIVADVAGFNLSGNPTDPGSFGSVAPSRLLDTRSSIGVLTAEPVAPFGVVALQVAGRGGVPASGVSSVVLNVTVTAPTDSGFLTAYADGSARPTASNVNFIAGQTVPNLVVAPVGADGKVDIYNGSAGSTQIIADVAGYYLDGTPSAVGSFGSLAPSRLLDTRSGVGVTSAAPVAATGTVALQVEGKGGVPASGVSAVILNVTVTAPTGSGFLTVYADGNSRPTASNVNFVAGQTVPNLVVAPVGADGKVDIYNGSFGTVQIVADVAGWYVAG